ncbi:MAG: pyridoxamine 5'-phosphate oxidase family protein [Actinomycetota bacterium]
MRWDEFAAACPEIATLAHDRFAKDQVVMVGTLRKDGSSRISPCEPDFADGRLMLGMMWQSKKALDLLRDPRIAVHSCTSDRMGTQGDIKLYGRAVEVRDPELRHAFREAIQARIDWAPEEPNFHLFSIEVESAGYAIFGDEHYALAWNPTEGLRRFPLG